MIIVLSKERKKEINLTTIIIVVNVLKKNSFKAFYKNVARYKSENNFVWTIKIIM